MYYGRLGERATVVVVEVVLVAVGTMLKVMAVEV